jgi:fructokinase
LSKPHLTSPHLILGIGELLWDILPEGERLGGAPANFAVMASRLGNHAAILSRIGRDALGLRAVNRLNVDRLNADRSNSDRPNVARLKPAPVDTALLQPVNTEFLQIDPAHPTGRVTVSFSAGEPQYTIHEPAAWDFLELSGEWVRLAQRADAICFGTLAQRNTASRQTIQTLAAETSSACVRVFDVNLRAPFFSSEIVHESLELTTVLKMNEEETPLLLSLLGLAKDPEPSQEKAQIRNSELRAGAQTLLAEFPDLTLVAITRGGRGSVLVKRDEWNEHPGFPVQVADPVGAGDAFTAALVHYLLRGADLATLNRAGNRWGAWMASQTGAMPDLPESMQVAISTDIERAG